VSTDPEQGAGDRTARRSTAWLLRALFTLQATMAIAQPVFIGRYLDGDFDQLSNHATNGSVLPAFALLCIGGSLAHWTYGRGRFWPVPVTVLLVPVEGAQLAAGYAHNLALHIPLGTSLIALVLFLAVWSWTPRIRIARGRRPRVEPAPADRNPGSPHLQPAPGGSA
jgi:hypothetical protein